MDNYFRPKTALCSEIIIERSRFIGLAFPIEDEDEAVVILNRLKKEYYDASHICYAFVADEAGAIARFSDSGEPQGTAGQPILSAIKSGCFKRTLVAVVRYFGGIKLGTGGLTRAYFDSAKAVLDSAKPDKFVLCSSYQITVSYSDFSVLEGKLKKDGYTIFDIKYESMVEFVAIDETENKNPTQIIHDITRGEGKVEEKGMEYVGIRGSVCNDK